MDLCLESKQLSRAMRVLSFYFFIGVTVLIVDQLTKYLALSLIPPLESVSYVYPYGGVGVFKNFFGIEFSIVHMTNKGAAWGVFGDYQHPLIILRFLLMALLLLYFFFGAHTSLGKVSLALVIFGALGNVLDYFFYGHVIDMLHFVLWGFDFPVFNIADTAISLGIGSMILFSWVK